MTSELLRNFFFPTRMMKTIKTYQFRILDLKKVSLSRALFPQFSFHPKCLRNCRKLSMTLRRRFSCYFYRIENLPAIRSDFDLSKFFGVFLSFRWLNLRKINCNCFECHSHSLPRRQCWLHTVAHHLCGVLNYLKVNREWLCEAQIHTQ